MSLAWATITRCVMWPLMSSPRMSWARALASSELSASFTPPALPRPPVFTCALTTTGAAISRAIASACSGVSATPPGSTGTPCEANRSRAWYSKRSTNRHRSPPVTRSPPRALRGVGRRGTHHTVPHPLAALRDLSGAQRAHRPAAPPLSPSMRSPTVRRAATVLVTTMLTAGGMVALPHRLVSPGRLAGVTKPVTIELPGIVHRFAAGHRLVVVLAGGDMAYRGSDAPQPVTLTTGSGLDQRLTVPVVN